MGAVIAQRIATVVLVAVFGFYLSQRRHLSHGERKRQASLILIGALVLFIGAGVVAGRNAHPVVILVAVAVLEVITLVAVRDRLLIFGLRCVSCGVPLPAARVLYFDHNQCPSCAPLTESDRQQSVIEAYDTPSSELGAKVLSLRRGGASPPRASRRSIGDVDWPSWRPQERAVLCFIRKDGRLLLIQKKRGLGAGKINGPGGRIESGESPLEAAVRETQEETGLTPKKLSPAAELSFLFVDGYSLQCDVFLADDYGGEMTSTDEADPFWCDEREIPFDRMWQDDRLWLPVILAGRHVNGRFIFDGDVMLDYEQKVE